MQQLIPNQANAHIPVNENFATLGWASVYGNDPETTAGLHRGYLGGRWGGFTFAAVDHTFGASTTTYVCADRSNGALNFSTSSTNYLDAANFAIVETVVSGASSIALADVIDDRAGPGGVHGSLDATALGGAATVTALSIASGVVNIDCSLGDYFTLTLTANVTSITFSNLPGSGKGASKWIEIAQGGSYTVAWPASFKWAGGTAGVVSTASATDELAITTVNNGTAWKATIGKAFA